MPDDQIIQWGSPVLYERAPAVKVFDDLLRAQAARLARTLQAADGAGLAAVQVGSLRRMFAFRASAEDEIDHLDGILTLHRADRAERYRAITALLSLGAADRRQAA